MTKYKIVACPTFFLNAVGNDEFSLGYGSKGGRVEQLKQALNVLGATIDETDFGDQTRNALKRLGYQPLVLDEKKFNEIILRAYQYGGKKTMTLTEPQMRALYEKEVSLARRDKVTFEVWLKRHGIKRKIGQGGKAVFDVLFGWLQLRASGGNLPSEQPVDTNNGFFSRADDKMPIGYYVIGGILLGFGIWGVSALIKRNQKIIYIPQS